MQRNIMIPYSIYLKLECSVYRFISLLLLLIAAHEVAQMKAARSAARRRLCQLLDAAAERSIPSTPAKGGEIR